MKKFVIGAAMLALAATHMFADGKVLNIYVWNDEFTTRFQKYYEAKKPKALEGVKVNWIQTPNQDNAYQNKLDEALLKQSSAKADDKVDIFLVEADYALKYTKEGIALDVMKDVGLTKKDMANQFQYTKDVVTDAKGKIRGVTWQACPGGLVYRRSIAKELFGTDDPDQVQAKLSDWNKFNAVAADAKAKGYFMVSGYDDTYRTFDDNRKSAWVKGKKIVVDPQIKAWIDQTKEFTEKGYNNKTSLWSSDWSAGMLKNGKTFCYFGPAWFVDFSMPHKASDPNAADGDWAFCKGPQGYSWGGTWICAAAGSDNVALIKDIMLALTCNESNLVDIAKNEGDFTNNEPAMNKVAASDYKNDFLGGQNHMAFFIQSAASIHKDVLSSYDQTMTEQIQKAMKDYFDGKVTLDKAWDNFYTSVIEKHPELKK